MTEPHTVLLVEDNAADVRLTTEALLEAAIPCALRVASTGREALALLRSGTLRPDLIILDLELPGLSGLEVLAELGADPALRMIPVAMFTSRDDEQFVRDAYALGANCYLTKPRDLGDFVTVVRELEEFWFGTVRLPEAGTGAGAGAGSPVSPGGRGS
jgi:two-component system, chemotaxis family, response regulator Rcp1